MSTLPHPVTRGSVRGCLRLPRFASAAVAIALLAAGNLAAQNANEPGGRNEGRRPNGPWNNDVLIFRTGPGGAGPSEQLTTFPRAGVPTLARLADGRLAAAFQHFPEDDQRHFDRVAVRFSTDEGQTWTDARPIEMEGLPEGLARPFDPTLVPLPDGRVRLYFTSNRSPDFQRSTPEIYSAISTNAVHYTFEPGVRFGLTGRIVIDCAVALHDGVFHLFVPDNGSAATFRDNSPRGNGPQSGTAYHATSRDGLAFVRQTDVVLDGAQRWLGNAQSEGGGIRFFGTGGRGGIWSALSPDGERWTLDESFASVGGADPGAVRLKDGGWLLAVTGPPRDGTRFDGAQRPGFGPGPGQGQGQGRGQGPGGGMGMGPGQGMRAQVPPILYALDANSDGTIDEWELANASALLRRLDRNEDGRLTPDELRPMGPGRDGFGPGRPGGPGFRGGPEGPGGPGAPGDGDAGAGQRPRRPRPPAEPAPEQ